MLSSLLSEVMLNSIQQQKLPNCLPLLFTSCSTHPTESNLTHAKTSYSLLHSHSAFPSPHLALSCIFMGSTQSLLWCFFPLSSSLSSISDPVFPSASFLFVLFHLLGILPKIIQIPSPVGDIRDVGRLCCASLNLNLQRFSRAHSPTPKWVTGSRYI